MGKTFPDNGTDLMGLQLSQLTVESKLDHHLGNLAVGLHS